MACIVTFVYLLKILPMNYIKLLCAVVLLTLTSCTFTENMYINEDGTGKFSLDMDGSSLMAMIPKDSLNGETAEKDIDSTITFKQLFESSKDSIKMLPAAEQAKLKKLENWTMKIKMKMAEKQMLYTMSTDFKNVGELQDAMGTMNQLQSMGKNSGAAAGLPSGGFGNNAEMKYTYDGKKFSRKAILKKQAKKAEGDSADAYKMIYEASKYIVNYHFPKRVKKVSNETALYSDDRKTVTIEYPFNEYVDNPEKLDFVVEFEK